MVTIVTIEMVKGWRLLFSSILQIIELNHFPFIVSHIKLQKYLRDRRGFTFNLHYNIILLVVPEKIRYVPAENILSASVISLIFTQDLLP